MDIKQLQNRADSCTNMVQIEALFLSVTAGCGVIPREVRKIYADSVRRLGGLNQETGEVMEEMEW